MSISQFSLTPPPFLELNDPYVPPDITVFTLVVVRTQVIRSIHRGVDIPSILNVVNRDAWIYFAIISSSHFLVVMLYSLARVG